MKKNLLVVIGILVMGLTACGSTGSDSTSSYEYENTYDHDLEDDVEEFDYAEETEENTEAVVSEPEDTFAEENTTDVVESEPLNPEDYQVASSSWVRVDAPLALKDLVGKWVNDDDPNQIKVLEFSAEGETYYYRYYSIVPGNSIGINIANETTEWEYSKGTFVLDEANGWIDCLQYNSSTTTYISVEYDGYDGTLVSCDGTDKHFVKEW